MQVIYPVSTDIITDAKVYATESINYTMDYEGFENRCEKDLQKKMERIVYGKFGQLWVAEFCRLNGVNCKSDKSSPYVPDKSDLEIDSLKIDVKVSVIKHLVGQVSPGAVKADYDYFCFMLVDRDCKWVCPYGFISCEDFRRVMVEVERGQKIPGTNIVQKFMASYFLPENPHLIPFVSFLMNRNRKPVTCDKPFMMVETDVIDRICGRLDVLHKLQMQALNRDIATDKRPKAKKKQTQFSLAV